MTKSDEGLKVERSMSVRPDTPIEITHHADFDDDDEEESEESKINDSSPAELE